MRAAFIAVALMAAAANYSAAEAPGTGNEPLAEMAERGRSSPRGKAWLSATKFFLWAQCEHRIPAYANESGSRFTADMGAYRDLWRVSYPLSFTFRVMRPDDEVVYCYTITKNSRFGSWHFQDAYKQTKDGARIGPLPISNDGRP